MASTASKIAGALLDGLAPNHCVFCNMRCAGTTPICMACQADLPLIPAACSRCALPLADTDGVLICGNCQRQPPAFVRAIAPHPYTMPISELITRLKFGRDTRVASVLAQLMASPIRHHLQRSPQPNFLVPAPLHWWRRVRRGFNQASLLAQALSRHPLLEEFDLRVESGLCRKIRATAPQAGLSAQARRQNLNHVFLCRALPENCRVAIVDDVLTTGSTANAIAEALLAAGAAEVELWVCARTLEPGRQTVYSPAA